MSNDPAKPIPAANKMMINSITAAQDLVAQLDPLTDHEAEVRDRTATLLRKLLDRVEARRTERPSASVVALYINLEVHPDPKKAIHDHLVVPLLAITSAKNSRGLQGWETEWLDQANSAVWRDLQAQRVSETAKGTR